MVEVYWSYTNKAWIVQRAGRVLWSEKTREMAQIRALNLICELERKAEEVRRIKDDTQN